ncbi:MAG: hypothetical protein IIC27_06140 [Chloroflexi bacterium]|nr:hypothetical protein [Chloroflexota bacterium]
MAKDKKATPKLDSTVKVKDQTRMELPEYTRPYLEFQVKAGRGMRVLVKKSILNKTHSAYELIELEGTITDYNSNSVTINTGGERVIPWWSIHDWKILGDLEI